MIYTNSDVHSQMTKRKSKHVKILVLKL